MAKRSQVNKCPWKPYGHDPLAAGEVSTRAAFPGGDGLGGGWTLPPKRCDGQNLAWYEFPPVVGAFAGMDTKIVA